MKREALLLLQLDLVTMLYTLELLLLPSSIPLYLKLEDKKKKEKNPLTSIAVKAG